MSHFENSRTRDELKILFVRKVLIDSLLKLSAVLAVVLTHQILLRFNVFLTVSIHLQIVATTNIATGNDANHLSKNRGSACTCHSHS